MNILISLLSSGNSSDPALPAFLPPQQYLALAATLAIHPTLTTRATSAKRVEEANLALRYLRQVLETVGPLNGNLHDAFAFSGLGTSSRRGGGGRRREIGDDVNPAHMLDIIENDLAQSGAIWVRAEDIWQVIGWAFNCSVLHKKRWSRWYLWLDYMLDVLQKDWETRGAGSDGDDIANKDRSPREDSMIIRSLNLEGTTTGRERKIMRAVFADGSPKAATEFPEIWRNETKERKKDLDLKKIEAKIDIEADNYGDYMDDDPDSDLEDANPDPSDPLSTPAEKHSSASELSNLATTLGGTDAINLRLRILSLLSGVSAELPQIFIPLATLYENYLEYIRPLPLPTFFLLMSPSSLRFFSPSAASSFTQYILRSLIASAAPLPAKDDLGQQMLQESYLPFAANTNTIADNAKVSICIETLLRLLDKYVELSWTPALQDATDIGIEARTTKAKKLGKKKARDVTDVGDERVWLNASADRIRSIIHLTRP